ncbi:MAG: hypothetical protein JSS81_27535 [Acidobacteria bacterium]|nr:hypothetical protein [Acidobacteriota bacterium]
MNDRDRFRLEFYLDRLAAGGGGDAPPGLDEAIAGYGKSADLRGRIGELIEGETAGRFYAAVLLSAVDGARAGAVFGRLKTDQSLLSVQKSVGFGTIEIPAALLAADFLEAEDFPGPHFRRAEALAGWQTAVELEKRRAGKVFDENGLPRYADAVEARADAEKAAALRRRIESLKAGGPAERFYAAAVAQVFDEDESRQILESLLDEPATVAVLGGDLITDFPASQLAAEMLGLKPAGAPEPAGRNPFDRFLKWLGG